MRLLKTSELTSHPGGWIVFDFGNVIIEIDPPRSIEAFQTLGAPADLHLDADYFHEFETGALSAAGFRDTLRGQLRWAAADSSIDRAWNELLLEVPPRTLAKLHQLKTKGYKLALLSNTNPIHIQYPPTEPQNNTRNQKTQKDACPQVKRNSSKKSWVSSSTTAEQSTPPCSQLSAQLPPPKQNQQKTQ